MQGYFGFASLILMFCMVLVRTFAMKKVGIKAFVFGRPLLLIPPVFLIFAYQLVAYTFGLPKLFGEKVKCFSFQYRLSALVRSGRMCFRTYWFIFIFNFFRCIFQGWN